MGTDNAHFLPCRYCCSSGLAGQTSLGVHRADICTSCAEPRVRRLLDALLKLCPAMRMRYPDKILGCQEGKRAFCTAGRAAKNTARAVLLSMRRPDRAGYSAQRGGVAACLHRLQACHLLQPQNGEMLLIAHRRHALSLPSIRDQ